LVNPADEEDMALALNGKKKKIKKSDFIAAFNNVKLDAKQQENIFKKIVNAKSKWFDFIDSSFLSEDYKAAYKTLINRQIAKVV
jgi:serine/threonine-protein kinase HipA